MRTTDHCKLQAAGHRLVEPEAWSLQRVAFFRGQAAIEMVVALIGTLTLLFGGIAIFGWFSQTLVNRQVRYQRTRVVAGSTDPGKCNPYVQPALDLFGEGEKVNVVPCQ